MEPQQTQRLIDKVKEVRDELVAALAQNFRDDEYIALQSIEDALKGLWLAKELPNRVIYDPRAERDYMRSIRLPVRVSSGFVGVDVARNPTIPLACQGCRNYYGRVDGGNKLVCAIHPYGQQEESCPDFSEPQEPEAPSERIQLNPAIRYQGARIVRCTERLFHRSTEPMLAPPPDEED